MKDIKIGGHILDGRNSYIEFYISGKTYRYMMDAVYVHRCLAVGEHETGRALNIAKNNTYLCLTGTKP